MGTILWISGSARSLAIGAAQRFITFRPGGLGGGGDGSKRLYYKMFPKLFPYRVDPSSWPILRSEDRLLILGTVSQALEWSMYLDTNAKSVRIQSTAAVETNIRWSARAKGN